jgi:(2Fe-2S) ferredoxin
MRITVTVDQPTPEFQDKLLALLAEHAEDVETDTTWTEERATYYYRMLPARARRIVKEAVQRGGMVRADALRDNPDDSLRGHSAPLSRILQRGKMLKRWPEAMKQPVTGVGPSFGKVEGYEIAEDLIPVFEAAIRNVEHLHSARVNELRESVRANKPDPIDDAPLRDAVARQDAAMRANQEPTDRADEK